MNEIVRSRNAMAIAAAGAALVVLGELLEVIAFAVLNINSPSTYVDLGHAHDWLFFAGVAIILGAVLMVTWSRIVHSQVATHAGHVTPVGHTGVMGSMGQETAELVGASLATLFLAIGALVEASSNGSTAGNALAAVGFGLWGLLALSRAGRHNLSQNQPAPTPGSAQLAGMWLAVALGLILLAVGYGIGYVATDRGSSIAASVIAAIGIAVWLGAMVRARTVGLLRDALVVRILIGLGIAIAAFVGDAIVAAIEFGPNGTVLGLRIGGAIVVALLGLAIAAFGLTAWSRALALPAVTPSAAPPATGFAAPASSFATPSGFGAAAPAPTATSPSVRYCTSCGAALAEGTRFCGSCGAPTGAP